MSINTHVDNLISKHWMSGVLSKAELSSLLQKTTLVSYRKKETVVKRGEFATHVVFLVEGFVKLEIEEGKRNFIINMEQGADFLGMPVILSLDKHMFSIVTLTEVQVLFFPQEVIKQLIMTNNKFANAVIQYGNKNFVLPLLEKFKSVSQSNIKSRLAKLVLQLSKEIHKSNSFNLLISRAEMSEMIGFSRENVIRVLTEFNNEGLITINGKTMRIINPERLEEIASS